MYRGIVKALVGLGALLALGMTTAFAQDAAVKVRVSPPEAYIFVDGQPFAHRSQTIHLSAGEHTIGVYNYGFVPKITTVSLEPGRNPEIVARLEPVPGNDTGPWGRLQIEGNANDKAAVFINEMKPEYFVGHVDEMNNAFMNSQKLVLPVGTYKIFLVNPGETQPFYTGQIEIRNNQRLRLNVANDSRKYHDWKHVGKREELPRFKTGHATATIAVVPVTGSFNVDKTEIKCGENVQLTWNSTEARETTIAASPAMEVPQSGQRTDSPTKTTTYTFEAKGPGGIVTQSQTVHVDPTVQTAMAASPVEIHYRRIDDKVITPANTNLTWKTDNAQEAKIDPVGTVPTSGERQVTVTPTTTAVGAVDEMHTYTLVATNNCGGQDKSLAAVHVTGTIEPLPVVPLASIFFPTAYPTAKNPELGLFEGEQEKLAEAVAGFNKFLEYDPATTLKIIAFADPRSNDEYNMALSERRANLIKSHLIALGVNESKIQVEPKGETDLLTREDVAKLEGKDRVPLSLVNAYNRRTDIVMVPTEKPQQASEREYPHDIKGARQLSSGAFQSRRTVEKLSEVLSGASASGQE